LSGDNGLHNAGVLLLVDARAFDDALVMNNVLINDGSGDGNLMVLDIGVGAGNNSGSHVMNGVLTSDGVGARNLNSVLLSNDAGNLDGNLTRLVVSIRNLDELLNHDGLGNENLLISESDTRNLDGGFSIVKDGLGDGDLVVLDSNAKLGDGNGARNGVDMGNSISQRARNRDGSGLNVSSGNVDGSGRRNSITLQNNSSGNVSIVLNVGRTGQNSGGSSSVLSRNCGLNLLLNLLLRLSRNGHFY